MSVYGLELRDENEAVSFSLTNRMTNLIWSKEVGANASGETYVHVPKHFRAIAHAVPITSDSLVRHMPHRITFNPNNGHLTWAPSLSYLNDSVITHFIAEAQPVRAASKIQVIGYVPQ